MLGSIERLPANEAREDEPDRCNTCGMPLDHHRVLGDICGNLCGININISAMLGDIDEAFDSTFQAGRIEKDPVYAAQLIRRLTEWAEIVTKLHKEMTQ